MALPLAQGTQLLRGWHEPGPSGAFLWLLWALARGRTDTLLPHLVCTRQLGLLQPQGPIRPLGPPSGTPRQRAGEGPTPAKVSTPTLEGLGHTCTPPGLPILRKDPGGSRSRGPPLGGQVPRAQPPFARFPQYYAECHGVIYVIDSTDEERLAESKRAFGGCGSARAGAEGLSRFRLHIPRVQSQARTGHRGTGHRGACAACGEGGRSAGAWGGQTEGVYCRLFTRSREDGHERSPGWRPHPCAGQQAGC